MTPRKNLILSLASALTLVGGASAYASTPALQGFTGGFVATSGSDQLYGWNFNVVSPINVLDLGVFDDGSDGLAIAHDVGIFRVSDTALLGSATVPAGVAAGLDGGYRYTGTPAFVLAPGAYVIAMTMPQGNADLQYILADLGSVVTAPEIQYLTSAFDGSSTLAFPNPGFNGAYNEGMFGPNFRFESATVTPDASSTMGLLAAGVTALAAFRRRQH
jgi:hypothetical protein